MGLHIECGTLDEFEDLLIELAPELIMADNMTAAELVDQDFKNRVPTILWQRPAEKIAS